MVEPMYKNPRAHVPSPEYNAARDTYGTLSKDQRNRVLDRVSELTDATQGPDAEAAFVRAVKEVQTYGYGGFYGIGPFV